MERRRGGGFWCREYVPYLVPGVTYARLASLGPRKQKKKKKEKESVGSVAFWYACSAGSIRIEVQDRQWRQATQTKELRPFLQRRNRLELADWH